MTDIVAGGAGFIGSHLCDVLIAKNHRVIAVDNLITGDLKNIAHLQKHPQFKFLEWDIIKPLKLDEKVDTIFHLASPASPIDYQNYPLETLLANSIGSYNLLELAKENNAKFLLASTSEVYGEPKVHPQKETYWGNVNPIGPRSCYDESKRFAESLTMTYIRKYNLDARIIRIFNTYGPRMQKDDGRVVSNFINQALKGEPLTLYGKGTQTRSFCYVDDLVRGIIKAIETQNTKGEVINLGNPGEYTVKELSEIIKEMTKSSSKIVYKPLPQDDPTRRKPDIEKANKLLGWKPTIPLNVGLTKTIEFFSQNR